MIDYTIAFIIIVILIFFYTRKQNKKNRKCKKSCKVKSDSSQYNFILPPKNEITVSPLEEEIVKINRSSMEDIYGNPYFRLIDQRVNEDPLTEPVKRYPHTYYPRPPLARLTNIYTKNIPDSFSFVGNLRCNDDNKILKLYGRRRYDDIWDYYAIFNTDDSLQTKVNLNTRNNKELFDGDEVPVDIFNGKKFKVFLHRQDQFTYSPYVMY
jgi:hypothetical protein